MNKNATLREMLAAPGVLQCGGVGDAGQALLVQEVGYPLAYLSGAFVNYTHGVPDGSLTLTDIVARTREIASRLRIPLVADADEGFGDILKVIRSVQEFERAGASAIHLEDMAAKKHGDLMPIAEMARRLQAARDARTDKNFVIIARTDALAPWRPGLEGRMEACEEDCLQRSIAYAQAGADLVMPIYASNSWYMRHGRQIPAPLVHLGGVMRKWPGLPYTPGETDLPASELEQYNVKMVIYGINILTRIFKLMQAEYGKWLAEGRFVVTPEDNEIRYECNKLIGLLDKEATLRKYGE